MTSFEVANIDEVKEGRGKCVVVDGKEIALFKVDGQVCAISNVCPHQKFSKLYEGVVENGIVTCPMHGWAYDIKTGISVNASGRVKTFAVEVKNRKVFVKT